MICIGIRMWYGQVKTTSAGLQLTTDLDGSSEMVLPGDKAARLMTSCDKQRHVVMGRASRDGRAEVFAAWHDGYLEYHLNS